jgi:hypothetical protein
LAANCWDFTYVLTWVKLPLKNLIKTNSVAYTELLVQCSTSAKHREFINCFHRTKPGQPNLRRLWNDRHNVLKQTCCTIVLFINYRSEMFRAQLLVIYREMAGYSTCQLNETHKLPIWKKKNSISLNMTSSWGLNISEQ